MTRSTPSRISRERPWPSWTRTPPPETWCPRPRLSRRSRTTDLNSDMLHTNGDFFEAVSFSGSHQAGLQAVIKGDVDVVPISDQILASEISHGNAAEGDVKVIHESGAIPAEAMVVGEHVDQETRDALTEFLTSYDNEDLFHRRHQGPGRPLCGVRPERLRRDY